MIVESDSFRFLDNGINNNNEFNIKKLSFLDFNHHYTEECNPAYFISYDKGKIEYTWVGASKAQDILKSNSIVLQFNLFII